jgi:hypothetical protein
VALKFYGKINRLPKINPPTRSPSLPANYFNCVSLCEKFLALNSFYHSKVGEI